MGLIQKKDEDEVIEGIEVIERSDEPDDLPQTAYDLVAGKSAEDISGTTEAKEKADAIDLTPDPELLGDTDEEPADPAEQDGEAEVSEADKPADDPAPADPSGTDPKDRSAAKGDGDGHGPKPGLLIAIAVIAVIVAAIVGYAIGHGGFGATDKGASSSSLTEEQLDTVVASYTYNGASTDITARQVLESQYSLEAVVQDDGTYPTPAADSALAYARNHILLAEAEARGITVSDDEMTEFAESSIGTSDYAEMAENYNLTEDQAREVVRQQATLQKLYKQVVPEVEATAPTAPTEPESGDSSERSKDYADYIIGLLGDEWDATANTWASEDGTFYSALSGTDFTADSASYDEALTAYYTAYQVYSEQSSEAQTVWSDFQDGLYANADIQLFGLYV